MQNKDLYSALMCIASESGASRCHGADVTRRNWPL